VKAPLKLALVGIWLVVAFGLAYASGTHVEPIRTAHDTRDDDARSADKRPDQRRALDETTEGKSHCKPA
jgi:hypothetical protein